MEGVRVLMAEDEPEVLEIMAKKVKAAGFDVITASDGEEAWQKIGHDSPDIILLDITMPKLDGFTVLKRLRESGADGKWQPVIIISAHQDFKDIQKGFSLEADHYLTKPCPIDDVLKAIRLMAALIPQRKPGKDI
jgi:two-component system OmpR family response regulator